MRPPRYVDHPPRLKRSGGSFQYEGPDEVVSLSVGPRGSESVPVGLFLHSRCVAAQCAAWCTQHRRVSRQGEAAETPTACTPAGAGEDESRHLLIQPRHDPRKDMADSPLNDLLSPLIETLVLTDTDEGAALASLLLAAQIALRDGRLVDLAVTAWAFIDDRRGRTAREP